MSGVVEIGAPAPSVDYEWYIDPATKTSTLIASLNNGPGLEAGWVTYKQLAEGGDIIIDWFQINEALLKQAQEDGA